MSDFSKGNNFTATGNDYIGIHNFWQRCEESVLLVGEIHWH